MVETTIGWCDDCHLWHLGGVCPRSESGNEVELDWLLPRLPLSTQVVQARLVIAGKGEPRMSEMTDIRVWCPDCCTMVDAGHWQRVHCLTSTIQFDGSLHSLPLERIAEALERIAVALEGIQEAAKWWTEEAVEGRR